MTNTNKEFLNYFINDILMHEEVSSKRLFGGYGIYLKDKIFALCDGEEIYIKESSANKEILDRLNAPYFYYTKKDEEIKIRYRAISEDVFEDKELLWDLIYRV